MSGLFNSFLSKPAKARDDSFISNLNESNAKSKNIQENTNQNYDGIYNDAYKALTRFVSHPDNESSFLEATEKFGTCLKLKPGHPESYFYLSYIFHICGENESAIRYLNMVKFIDPNFDGLVILENDINKSLLYSGNISARSAVNTIKESSDSSPKPEIKRISQVKRIASLK